MLLTIYSVADTEQLRLPVPPVGNPPRAELSYTMQIRERNRGREWEEVALLAPPGGGGVLPY